MDPYLPAFVMIVLMQFLTVLLIVAYGREGRGTAPERKSKNGPSDKTMREVAKLEEASKEVQRLKDVLKDPERLKDLAILRYKGNVEKAKKEVQDKLRKYTGETFEAPIEK